MKTSSGHYQFTSTGRFEVATERIRRLDQTLAKAVTGRNPQNTVTQIYLANGGARSVKLLSGADIEDLLFARFPQTIRFGAQYPLIDVLPDIITSHQLATDPGPLTTAFLTFLGRDNVERLLTAQDPTERRALLQEMRAKVRGLVQEINRGRTEGSDILDVDLDRADGLQVTLITSGKPSFYRHISDNTKFIFAYHLYSSVYDLHGQVLLFDEPNNGFHATAQEKLLRFLQELGKRGPLVVVSTHSEHLIDPDYLGGVRLMGVDAQGYLTVSNHYYKPVGGEGDMLALRPIADAIGLRYGAIRLLHADKVIVTEGVTDRIYLLAFRQLLSYEQPLHIAPAMGEQAIPHVVALLIAQGIAFKLAIDTSTGGSTVKSRVQRAYQVPDECIKQVPIPATSAQKHGSGVEDLFSKRDFRCLLESVHGSVDETFDMMSNSEYMKKPGSPSKRVTADLFVKHLSDFSVDSFDDETLTLFRQTLDFCTNDAWFRTIT